MTDPIRFKLGLAGGLVTDAEGDWITYRTHVAAIARLTAERDEWREADRAECEENRGLVEQLKGCSSTIVHYQSEFSRLDYALGPPNEMQVSLYDMDFDETRVVDAALARLADLQGERDVAELSRDAAHAECARLTRERDGLATACDAFQGELIELRLRLAECEREIERLKITASTYQEAYGVALRATHQSHNGHWDMQGTSGANCPECIRAREARENCEAVIRRGLDSIIAAAIGSGT